MKKAKPSNTWKQTRQRYLWFMDAPWFKRSHWWESQPELVTPMSALYELARRHPEVGAAAAELRRSDCETIECKAEAVLRRPSAVACLCLIGSEPWDLLEPQYRAFWRDVLSTSKIKGVDTRSGFLQCRSLVLEAAVEVSGWPKRLEALVRAQLKLKPGEQIKPEDDLFKARSLVVKTVTATSPSPAITSEIENLCCENPPSKEMEAAVAQAAVEALRGGYELIAIARDLQQKKAAELMAKSYRERSCAETGRVQRARYAQTTKVKTEPDNAEGRWAKCTQPTPKQLRFAWLEPLAIVEGPTPPKAPDFDRYKKIVDSVRFPRRFGLRLDGPPLSFIDGEWMEDPDPTASLKRQP